MGNVHLVTGYAGQEHITSSDDGALNKAIFGAGQYVLGSGTRLAANVITNNQIRILDGDAMMQGRLFRIDPDAYVDLTIENGTAGMYRNDLIVARYTRNASSNIEDCNLVVIKGVSDNSKATDPAYTSVEDIDDTILQADMPLYRVPLDGLNVQDLVPLFTVVDSTLHDLITKQEKTNSLNAETTLADGDYFPFYDTSAGAHKKTLWSNIIAKIRTALFGSITGILKADGSGNLSTSTVKSTEIADGAITTGKIADGAVSTTYTATVATGWSGSAAPYTKATTISGLLASDNPIIDLVPSSTYATAEKQIEAWGYVYKAVITANTLTLYATEKPTVSLPIQLKVVRK